MVLERVASSNGTLRALCRVQPKDPGAVAEARRCLDAGASGIKLHPRAEQFTLSEPSVRDLVAAAHERRGTVLIHAGRGIPALGQDTVHLAEEFPDARIIALTSYDGDQDVCRALTVASDTPGPVVVSRSMAPPGTPWCSGWCSAWVRSPGCGGRPICCRATSARTASRPSARPRGSR